MDEVATILRCLCSNASLDPENTVFEVIATSIGSEWMSTTR